MNDVIVLVFGLTIILQAISYWRLERYTRALDFDLKNVEDFLAAHKFVVEEIEDEEI